MDFPSSSPCRGFCRTLLVPCQKPASTGHIGLQLESCLPKEDIGAIICWVAKWDPTGFDPQPPGGEAQCELVLRVRLRIRHRCLRPGFQCVAIAVGLAQNFPSVYPSDHRHPLKTTCQASPQVEADTTICSDRVTTSSCLRSKT